MVSDDIMTTVVYWCNVNEYSWLLWMCAVLFFVQTIVLLVQLVTIYIIYIIVLCTLEFDKETTCGWISESASIKCIELYLLWGESSTLMLQHMQIYSKYMGLQPLTAPDRDQQRTQTIMYAFTL